VAGRRFIRGSCGGTEEFGCGIVVTGWRAGVPATWQDVVVTNSLPFAKLLGIEITAATPEKVTAELLVREELCTRPAVLHGGAIMSLADTLGAVATMLNLPERGGTTTIESKTNFLGPAAVGSTVVAECMPIHRGKRTMVWQTRISTKEGRLVAMVTQTQLVLEANSQS